MARPHRRLVRIAVVLSLGLAVVAVLRFLKGTTGARRDPEQGPVVGSVDTWPAVPRSPAKARSAA